MQVTLDLGRLLGGVMPQMKKNKKQFIMMANIYKENSI